MAKFAMWLTCPECRARRLCDADALASRLRAVGMLRRDAEPSDELVRALMRDVPRPMVCEDCGRSVIMTASEREPGDDCDDTDWGDARTCARCSRVIPRERLEVFPNATLCTECQSQADQGVRDDIDPEYCPRCGGLLEITLRAGGGITGYRLFCRQCGR